jgi:hypothetical protein
MRSVSPPAAWVAADSRASWPQSQLSARQARPGQSQSWYSCFWWSLLTSYRTALLAQYNRALLGTTNTILRIRTAARRFLTNVRRNLRGRQRQWFRCRIPRDLFRFSPPEAGAILDRGHAKTGAEYDSRRCRRTCCGCPMVGWISWRGALRRMRRLGRFRCRNVPYISDTRHTGPTANHFASSTKLCSCLGVAPLASVGSPVRLLPVRLTSERPAATGLSLGQCAKQHRVTSRDPRHGHLLAREAGVIRSGLSAFRACGDRHS